MSSTQSRPNAHLAEEFRAVGVDYDGDREFRDEGAWLASRDEAEEYARIIAASDPAFDEIVIEKRTTVYTVERVQRASLTTRAENEAQG